MMWCLLVNAPIIKLYAVRESDISQSTRLHITVEVELHEQLFEKLQSLRTVGGTTKKASTCHLQKLCCGVGRVAILGEAYPVRSKLHTLHIRKMWVLKGNTLSLYYSPEVRYFKICHHYSILR